MAGGRQEVWTIGPAYEAYVGRWSRVAAGELVRWLGVARGRRWLDVGCGTGALVEAIVAGADPAAVLGVDRSEGFLAHARARVCDDARVAFQAGDAEALPVRSAAFDAVVSGLVLNFVREPAAMVAEMARAGRPGSAIALYVWDYAEGMEPMRRFWDAATSLDSAAAALDEGARFPICAPGPLEALFADAGLSGVAARAIDVRTRYRDFDDYWAPFLGGQGPAPGYASSLPEERREALRERVRTSLPGGRGGFELNARAWAVRGTRTASAASPAP